MVSKKLFPIVFTTILSLILTISVYAQEATPEATQLPITLEKMAQTQVAFFKTTNADGSCTLSVYVSGLTKYVFPMDVQIGLFQESGPGTFVQFYTNQEMPENGLLQHSVTINHKEDCDNGVAKATFFFRDGESVAYEDAVIANVGVNDLGYLYLHHADDGWGLILRTRRAEQMPQGDYHLYISYTKADGTKVVKIVTFGGIRGLVKYRLDDDLADVNNLLIFVAVSDYWGILDATKVEDSV